MGNSASADIFFGVIVHDKNGDTSTLAPWLDEDGEGDFDAYASEKLAGLKRPDEEFPDRDDHSETAEEIRKRRSDYWAKQREILAAFPLETDHVGYMDGGSVTVLKLKGWGANVYDYGCEVIDPRTLVVSEEQAIVFAESLAKLGITGAPAPQIFLAASYG